MPPNGMTQCTDDRGHAWVHGPLLETPAGYRVESRYCRRCGEKDDVTRANVPYPGP